jgi:type IV secretory pathway VirB2 component (pilin)
MSTQTDLYNEFLLIAGVQSSVLDSASDSLAGIMDQARQSIDDTARAAAAVAAAAADTAAGVGPRSAASAPAGSGGGFSLADTLTGIFAPSAGVVGAAVQGSGGIAGRALGVLKDISQATPVGWIADIFGLFGGDDTPAPLVKYALPEPVNFVGSEVPNSGGAVDSVSYDQFGAPRVYDGSSTSTSSSALDPNRGTPPAPGLSADVTGPGAAAAFVNGTAVDPRVWTDNADAIARAVAGALGSVGSLSDAINEL